MVTMGNSTTGHMRMVRETECSLKINATLQAAGEVEKIVK